MMGPSGNTSPGPIEEFDQQPNEPIEQEKVEEQEDLPQKSDSETSEFVYNPDPDFLSKINANIRQNNEVICGGEDDENQEEIIENQNHHSETPDEDELEYHAQDEEFAALDTSS